MQLTSASFIRHKTLFSLLTAAAAVIAAAPDPAARERDAPPWERVVKPREDAGDAPRRPHSPKRGRGPGVRNLRTAPGDGETKSQQQSPEGEDDEELPERGAEVGSRRAVHKLHAATDDDENQEGEQGEASEGARPAGGHKPKAGPSVRASTEVSGYTDTDAVHVLSPTVAGSIGDEVAGWSVSGSYLVDAVSAASVDIVSSASHHWVEQRHAGAAAADFKAAGAQVSLAGGFSREPDYFSVGGGGMVSLELNDKNFLPFFGGSYGHDLVGRTGDPQRLWRAMNKVSLKTGATFVVDRSTIAALSMDAIFERGYLAKPYRYLPVLASGATASVPAGAPIDLVKSLSQYSVSENVPEKRDRFALAGRMAHRFSRSTFRGDQRLYMDSWGLKASTTDIHHFVDLGSRVTAWPHLRAHVQNGVDFWKRVLEQVPNPAGGPPGIPALRAGDRELGPLYTFTAGFGVKVRINGDVHAPWTLSLQIDGMYTRYEDAIYISRRRAVFSAVSFESAF